MIERLFRPFLSPRFLKFAAVGASGVVVNLGVLALCLGPLGLHSTVASALAIQVSILTNFVINEGWTFADVRVGTRGGRLWSFQLVSLVGAAVQLLVFLLGNLVALALTGEPGALAAYFAAPDPAVGPLQRYLLRPVIAPPEVGPWVYGAQLAGIAVATVWNFLANLRWTWRRR